MTHAGRSWSFGFGKLRNPVQQSQVSEIFSCRFSQSIAGRAGEFITADHGYQAGINRIREMERHKTIFGAIQRWLLCWSDNSRIIPQGKPHLYLLSAQYINTSKLCEWQKSSHTHRHHLNITSGE